MVATGMDKFYEDIQTALKIAVARYGSIRKLAEAVEMNPSTISKWLETNEKKPQRSPNVRELAPIMDLMGIRALLPEAYRESSGRQFAINQDKLIDEIKQKLFESEMERASLSGEVRALEKQLARMTPSQPPFLRTGGDADPEGGQSKTIGEKEQLLSGLKTANG